MTEQEINQLLITACKLHSSKCAVMHDGEVWIDLDGLEAVLSEMPPEIRVVEFETFRIVNGSIYPQLEYLAAFGIDGTSIPDALAAIADWPHATELWIYPTLLDSNEPYL